MTNVYYPNTNFDGATLKNIKPTGMSNKLTSETVANTITTQKDHVFIRQIDLLAEFEAFKAEINAEIRELREEIALLKQKHPIGMSRETVAELDIERLLNEPQLRNPFYSLWNVGLDNEEYMYYPNNFLTTVRFHCNKAKRTVVALLLVNGEVARRGIAKCMPEDFYSEEVGKAIALHRLFNRTVPAIYVD